MVQLGYSNYIQGRTFQTWSEVFQERDLEYGAHMRTWWHPESGVVRDCALARRGGARRARRRRPS